MALKTKSKGRLLVDIFRDEVNDEVGHSSSTSEGVDGRGNVLVVVLSGESANRVRSASLSLGVSEADVVTMAIESHDFNCN
jgi:hypothetical protein